MDIMAILALVAKGVEVINTLVTVGENAAPAIKAVRDLVVGAQNGTVTSDQLTQTEAVLDALIEDFNKPIP